MRVHFGFVLFFMFLFLSVSLCNGQPDLRSKIKNVYVLLVKAEKEGGNVTAAASKLNEALQLIDKAEKTRNESEKSKLLGKADSLIKEVELSIPEIIEKGQRERKMYLITTFSSLALLLFIGFIFYFYGPKFFWSLWLKSRRKWKIRRN